MVRDCLGNPVCVDREETRAAIDDFIEGFLAYDSRAERVLGAADRDPDCCLANVYAGFLWMLLEAPEAPRRALKYLSAAQRCAPLASRREALNTALLRAWVDDDLDSSVRLCDEISDQFPRDLAIVKLHQYFDFNRGNAPAMLRSALKVMPSNSDVAFAHGMTAFAYEECHLLDEAEAAAQTAIRMRRAEPWAQHALAHVMLARGRIAEGAQFLEGMTDTWGGLNSFMSTHLWWHLGLFYLSMGRDAAVLELFDAHCWGVEPRYSQDQIGAVSLLARIELAGTEVGERWQDVANYLIARTHDTVQPFLTLQYLYGLARAGRTEADTLLESVRRHASSGPAARRELWQDVALPACEGLYAYAHRNYADAFRHLSAALPRMMEIGGSHAQRDLFELLLLDAAQSSGRLIDAQQLLERRRSGDPDGVPVNAALAGVYSKLGLPAAAAAAAARAQATRSRYA